MPIPNSVGDWLQLAENGWSRLKSYEELGEWAKLRTSYLYYEDVEGRRWGRTAWPGVPSQYFRQELAAALGFPERGDWRASRDIEPLERMLAINHADPLII